MGGEHGFLGVDVHVVFGAAAGVEVGDVGDDCLVLVGDFEGFLWEGFIVDIFADAFGKVVGMAG